MYAYMHVPRQELQVSNAMKSLDPDALEPATWIVTNPSHGRRRAVANAPYAETMDEFDEKTADHSAEAHDLDDAVAALESLSQRRIALEAVDEQMD